MANPDRGEATVEIGGQSYTLKAGVNMMRALEHLFSTPSRQMTTLQIIKLADEGSFTHYCGIVWAMLRKHHPELTLDAVGDLIDAAGGPTKLEEVFTGLLLSLVGDPADLKALGVTGNPPKAQALPPRGTGGRSSRKRGASA